MSTRAVPSPESPDALKILRLLRDMQEAPSQPKIEALRGISTADVPPEEARQILSGLLVVAIDPEHGSAVRGEALRAFTRGVQETREAATADHAALLVRIAADNDEVEAIRLMALTEALSAVVSKSPAVTFSLARPLSILAAPPLTHKKMKKFEALKTTPEIRDAATGLYREIESVQGCHLSRPEPS